MDNLYNRRQAKLELYRLEYEHQQQQQPQQPPESITHRDPDDYDDIDCA